MHGDPMSRKEEQIPPGIETCHDVAHVCDALLSRKEEQIPPGIETLRSCTIRVTSDSRKEEQIPPGIETIVPMPIVDGVIASQRGTNPAWD